MTTRARKDRIVVALNTVGGRIVDESSLADGAFLRYDALNDRYVHYIIDNYDGFVPYTGAIQDLDLGEYSLNTTSVKFNTSQYTGIPNDGELYWDYLNKCLNLPIEGKELNIGEELWVPLCLNDSGEDLINGTPVYIFNSFNGYPTIRKANSMEYSTSRLIGVVTETIPNGQIGRVTRFGYVRNIDLSAFSAGDEIFVGPTGIQNTRPTGGCFPTSVGKCITPGTTGKMLVYPRISEYTDEINKVRGHPSYVQGDHTNISFTDLTRTFTISPVSTSFYYYQDGAKYIQTAPKSVIISDNTGLHYIYFDGYDLISAFAPTTIDIIEIIKNKVFTGVVYWDVTTQTSLYFGNERHTFHWPSWLHYNMHTTRGTQYISGLSLNGFTIGNGSLNSHAQFGADAGTIDDEGILSTTNQIVNTQGLPIYYRLGNPYRWVRTIRAGYSFLNGTNYAQFNLNTAGTWSLQELTNGYFMLVHIFATNDMTTNKTIAVTGVSQYDSLSSAVAGVNNEVFSLYSSSIPFVEFRHVATVILESKSSFSNTVKTRVAEPVSGQSYLDFRRSQVAGGVASGSTAQSFLSLSDTPISYETHANKLVQVNSLATGLTFSNTINDNLTVNGIFYINGDIIQSGSTYETHAEQVYSTQDYIILREGAISGLAPGTYSGIRAKLYDGTNDGHLVFDNTGIARVGDVGSEQPLATRIENPTNGQIAYWEGANNRLNFKTLASSDISDLGNGTLTAASGTSGATNTTVTLNFSVPYSANTSTNTTINPVIGPALSNLATYMTGTSNIGFIKKTAADTYTVDTNTYLTSISLIGEVIGSGSTTIDTTIADTTVTGKLLTGYIIGTNAALAATDSILGAFGKVQAQLNNKQPLDADLTSIAGLSGTSGLLRKTAANTWSLDTNTYATTSQLHSPVTVTDSSSINLTLIGQDIQADAIFGTTAGTIAEGNHAHAAYINQNAFSNIAVSGQTTIAADSATDTFTLVAGNNISITTDVVNDSITINAVNTGTVTSVGLTTPTGLTVTGSPIITSGSFDVTFTTGYSIPTTASQANWNTAYGWGNHATAGYALASNYVPYTGATGSVNLGAYNLTGNQLISTTTSTAPLAVASQTVVSNLNSELFNGLQKPNVIYGNSLSGHEPNTGGSANDFYRAAFNTIYQVTNAPFAGDGGLLNIPAWVSQSSTNRYNLQIAGALNNPASLWYRATDINGAGTWYKILNEANFTAGTHYQAPLTNPVTGTGTINVIPKFTGLNTIGNSSIFDNGAGYVKVDTYDFALDGADAMRKIHLNYNSSSWPNYSSQIIQTGANLVAGTMGLILNANTGLADNKYGINLATDNTSKLFVQHTGNVGINTINPVTKLQIEKSDQAIGTTVPSGGFLLTNLATGNAGLELGLNGSNGWIQSRNITTATFYNLLLNPSSGNVGIGITTTPKARLHISSDATDSNQPSGIQGSIDNHTGLYLGSSGDSIGEKYGLQFGGWKDYSVGGIFGLATSGVGYSTGDITVDMRVTSSDTSLTEVLRITNSGNIGIGTSNPNSPWQKTVDLYAPSNVAYALATNTKKYFLINAGDNDAFAIVDYDSANYTRRLLISSTGDVAIGNTTPQQKLDVTGNARFSAIGSSVATSILGVTADGTLTTNTSYNLYTEWLHSNRDFMNGTLVTTSINYSVTNGEPWIFEIKGNSYGGGLPIDIQIQGYIYGDTIINGGGYSNGYFISGIVALNVGGYLCFWFPRQGYWQGYKVKAYIAYAGTRKNLVTNIADVVKPTGTKEVEFNSLIKQSAYTHSISNSYLIKSNGTGGFTQTNIYSTENYPLLIESATDHTVLRSDRNGTRSWQIDNVNNDLWIYNNATTAYTFVMKSDSGNIGIGTTTPNNSLTINREIYPSFGLYSSYNYSNNRNWDIITNSFGSATWGGFSIRQSDGFGTSPTISRFGIDLYGNVGINNLNPQHRLDVNGWIKFGVGGSGGVRGYPNTIAFNSTGSPVSGRLEFGTDGTGYDFRIAKNQLGTITDILTINDSNRVGIGGSPSSFSLLNVQGESEYAISWARGTVSKHWSFGSDNNGTYLRNMTDLNIPIFFKNNGDIGIGTTSPTQKLTVVGNIDLPSTDNWRYLMNSHTNGGIKIATGNSGGVLTDGISITSGGGYITLHHSTNVIGNLTVNSTQVVTNSGTWGISITGSTGDSTVTYAKLATDLTSRQAISASDINWASGGVYTKTLAANTTFTFSNLQLNKVITAVLSGNYTVALPAYCKRISGTYDGATTNYIQFHCTNNTSGQEEVWYTISKQA